jgi:hypothetical protein
MAQPYFALDRLYLFPYYRSRQDYRALTGKEAPAYDTTRPPKNWEDPAAAQSTRRTVVYENVLADVMGEDGKPTLDMLVLNKTEAATVNLYDQTTAGVPAPEMAPVPVPLRALNDNEELVYTQPGIVMVRDKSVPLPETQNGFTSEDRELLRAIAKKLSV